MLERARHVTRSAVALSRESGEPRHSVDRATRRIIEVLSSLLNAEEVSVIRGENQAPETYPVPFSDVKITEEFVRVLEIIGGEIDPDIELLGALLAVTAQVHSEILRAVEARYGRAAAFGSKELKDAYAEIRSVRSLLKELSSGEQEIMEDPVRAALVAAERAEAAVGPASEAGLGAEYARISASEERLRDRTRLYAVAGLLGFFIVSVVLLIIAPNEPANRETLARAALTIPGGTLFAYFSRQAAVHRRVAQRAGEIAAQLKTVGAFVTQFESQLLREEILFELSKVVFREVDGGVAGESETRQDSQRGNQNVPPLPADNDRPPTPG